MSISHTDEDLLKLLDDEENQLRAVEGLRMGDVAAAFARIRHCASASTAGRGEVAQRLMREMSDLLDDCSPAEDVGAYNGHAQWIHLATVREIRDAATPPAAETAGVKSQPDLSTVEKRNAFYGSAEYRDMTTAEKCAVQGDGFINDVD